MARILLPLAVALGVAGCHSAPLTPIGLPCHAVSGNQSYALDTDQAADAATIAAVSTRLGMPAGAVVVALAAALQESKLYNLPYGDLDSLGLFQQRPSQGWGTPSEILTPRYAAATFFHHLARVDGWETLSVADAAQAVQKSAAGAAYAQWEPEATVLTAALTGRVPAAFVCRIPDPATADPATADAVDNAGAADPAAPAPPASPADIAAALTADLGPPTLAAPVATTRGWQVAGWLIAHAGQLGVTTVSFNGRRWSSRTGVWKAHQPGTNMVEVTA